MKNCLLLAVIVSSLSLVGCRRPYHEEVYVDVATSEVAILAVTIDSNGQALVAPKGKGKGVAETKSEYYKKNLVSARKIAIPYYWHQTGRWSYTGEWRPSARLITVDTKPSTRAWSADAKKGTSTSDQGIWVESSDSVGFSTGISITARIENAEDAITFLSNYPPEAKREIPIDGGANMFNVEVTSLEQIMDQEIRQKIQEVYAEEAAGYPMDELRGKKVEIMGKVREVVTPFFDTRGITITSIGQFGGYTYENPKIQDAIDEVFTQQQDKEVAKAEAEAAEERKDALRLKGEGLAEQVKQEAKGKADAIEVVAKAEAEAVKAIADAKEYELLKLAANPEIYLELKRLEIQTQWLESWDGTLPQTILGDSAGLLMQMPTNTTPKTK